jgi:putative ABC transport system ATP-binding protein
VTDLPALDVRDVHKTYPSAQGPVAVLRGVTLVLRRGTSLALAGESGSGKSTLLHLLAGLDSVDSGAIAVDGVAVTGASDPALARLRRERVGLVFQQFNLIPSLTVAGNLGFQARLAGRLDPGWQAELGQRLGLAGLLERYPEQLSGGQQQRVAIGRALAARPGLILADEPTGNLDEAAAGEVLALLLELVALSRASLLMVTHSPLLAARLDRRVTLRGGRLG